MQLQLQSAAGVELTGSSFAASDTVKLLATLKTSTGTPAANEVVTFAESGSGLLQFMPTAATALTNASGQATVEVKAKALDALGATTVSATATVAATAYAASRNLAVTGAVVEGVDPQTLARAVNFIAAVPADQSIVIAGAGGSGRSETAILQFKVVDGTGAAVPGVRVAFQAIPANAVTLNSATGSTDASGMVSASVSSKASPTSVVVRANVTGTALATQSDTLTVTTSTAVPGAFDLSASKYALNTDISGDPSVIRIAVADANGNPVADGFPVVTTTSYGRVGTSGRGGCVTTNGICTVEYQVQDPRAPDGVAIPVLVTGKAYSVAQAKDIEISKTIYLQATSLNSAGLYASTGELINEEFTNKAAWNTATCKVVWEGFLATEKGFSLPAGTTLAVQSLNSELSVDVTSGSPVLDRPNGRTPSAQNSGTPVVLTITANNKGAPKMVGDIQQKEEAKLQFTMTAGTIVRQFSSTLSFDYCKPAT
ncbi:MAG: hypothetical protein RR311_19680 [Comamonas sp.]